MTEGLIYREGNEFVDPAGSAVEGSILLTSYCFVKTIRLLQLRRRLSRIVHALTFFLKTHEIF